VARILIFGDFVPTGFGRICRAIGLHLQHAGHEIMGACLQYDGLLPLGLPFHVAALNGRDHGAALTGIWAAYQPDLVLGVQDFPYHVMMRHATGIDWSTTAQVVITPVDGAPIYSDWIATAKTFDSLMTISEFGQRVFREQGCTAWLCPPGVDTNEFYRLDDTRRAELREKLDIPPNAFVVGVMAMNQGRKDFPSMVAGFKRAFSDVSQAYLYLDCERTSPAGWDIPKQLVAVEGLEAARVRYRDDALRAGIASLNERYNLLDVHMVLAHREGFGLPHIEAMATGVPTVAIDYCSGHEIIGDDERGALIKARPGTLGTWGGARDYYADMDDLVAKLRLLYEQPAERAARAARALAWARERTWERAARAVQSVVEDVLTRRASDLARKRTPLAEASVQAGVSPAGIPGASIHLHAPIYVMASNQDEVAMGIGKAVKQQIQRLEADGEHSAT